ncbi:flagella synthesis protein FlgN [Pararobbsia silviterrae]|uniref:Flagellar protein FlgN n=1 Tax=Pararobbsia silviterrae TaxID=1792498 RepID=A0A494X3U7_9BURK|nr:flagellar protein FlgN [Pararobbsia silviterrae]RKP45365.1 flagellar protein FlgN [Pararobbsia silviterrae]
MTAALLDALQEELNAVEAFTKVLEQEEAALIDGNLMAVLPGIVERKTDLTEKLSNFGKQREAALTDLGLPASREGMNTAIGSDNSLADVWKKLLTLAERARARNVTNGLLIKTRMDYNHQALIALRLAAGAPAIYGPDGRLPMSMQTR